ncbi:MAG: hypothetical protein WAW45_06590 [Atribacterota bacterium]
MIKINKGDGKHKVTLIAIRSGEDTSVIIYGGEKPHIGAVAVSIARPSLENLNKISSSTSVFTFIGHKEDEIAKEVAESITKATKRNTVAIIGLHIERATKEDINCLVYNIKEVVKQLKKNFQNNINCKF